MQATTRMPSYIVPSSSAWGPVRTHLEPSDMRSMPQSLASRVKSPSGRSSGPRTRNQPPGEASSTLCAAMPGQCSCESSILSTSRSLALRSTWCQRAHWPSREGTVWTGEAPPFLPAWPVGLGGLLGLRRNHRWLPSTCTVQRAQTSSSGTARLTASRRSTVAQPVLTGTSTKERLQPMSSLTLSCGRSSCGSSGIEARQSEVQTVVANAPLGVYGPAATPSVPAACPALGTAAAKL
mmetsp:Transcript_59137/g.183337  ORF Transcript_59137/g.183337 Transcript_59137/m.183337 type:complete len:237 (-) Transcript_59137:183-893(-)